MIDLFGKSIRYMHIYSPIQSNTVWRLKCLFFCSPLTLKFNVFELLTYSNVRVAFVFYAHNVIFQHKMNGNCNVVARKFA